MNLSLDGVIGLVEQKAYSTDILHPSHGCTIFLRYLERLKSAGIVKRYGLDVLDVPPILLCEDPFRQNEFSIVHGHHRAYVAATLEVYIEGIFIATEKDCYLLPEKEYEEWTAEDIAYAFRNTPGWRADIRTKCDSVLSMKVVDN